MEWSIRNFRFLLSLSIFLLNIGDAKAQPPTTELSKITVMGYPFYAPTSMAGDISNIAGGTGGHDCDHTKSDSYCSDSREQDARDRFCSALQKKAKDLKCNVQAYPAIPGFSAYPGPPSGAEYGSNACGGGSLSTAFASFAQNLLHFGSYSHDFNRPVKGYPNLDFSQSCIGHDICYTTSGNAKAGCDNDFFMSMQSVCAQAESDDVGGTCRSFAKTYFDGVSTFGNGAYEADQNAVKCNQLGRAYNDKKNHCTL